ncbi:hypothetical protein O181_082650 [Austropuccinia psidii MF-1]|uniref:Uncharacterized protein n=1 Tax=Austropuccinia psidii MF-1 TaxID=1389203 RepID=A0A9Q3IL19_9BASI|nr:hypothetical protein [Austropuccinia psidii MF-1]
MAINHHRTHFGPGSPWTTFAAHGTWYPEETTRSAQLKLSPHLKGNSSIPPCTPYSRLQEWCIYGIINHYAPFLLRNPMVTFSGANYIFPNQGPKVQLPFLKEDSLTHQSGNLWRQSEDQ